MTLNEMFASKLQVILGKQYKVFPFHAFNQSFTKPAKTPYGEGVDFNYQAFQEYSDKIIVNVQTQDLQLYSTPYKLIQNSYTLSFWLPINQLKTDENGVLLEPPKFDFYADFERLEKTLKSKEVTLTDGDTEYKVFLSISEPKLTSSGLERSGAYTRAIMQVTGAISLSDKRIGTGSDIEIALVVDGQESRIAEFTGFSIGSETDASALLDGGSVNQYQSVAQVAHGIIFSIDDFPSGEAFKLIEDKAWKNKTVLTPTAGENDKHKVLTKLYKRGVLMLEFWGILAATYSVDSKAGFGRYQVTISNDGAKEG